MKRFIRCILVSLMFVFALASCEQETDDRVDGENTETQATDTSVESQQGTDTGNNSELDNNTNDGIEI